MPRPSCPRPMGRTLPAVLRLTLALGLAAPLLGGCFELDMHVTSDAPVLTGYGRHAGRTFHHEARVYYYAWGLYDTDPGILDRLIAAEHGQALQAVDVSTHVDLVGAAVGIVTLGIVSSRIVTVEGEVRP